jgi:glycosyltransferase involved in cell wall biosynthesis
MFRGRTVTLIIPALDEEEALPALLGSVPAIVDRIVVADNGSRDRTADVARAGGALVVREERRGYGSACLAALRVAPDSDLFVFLDGDGSDDPREIPSLLLPLTDGNADLVIGSRVLGRPEPGALTPVQVFGNLLTCLLVRLFWRLRYTDLGPFRAITREALERLDMSDPDFGWTIEMQVKAAQKGLVVVELPVSRRTRRGGVSKVTGDLKASFLAGNRILGYVFSAKLEEWLRGPPLSPDTPRPRSASRTRSAKNAPQTRSRVQSGSSQTPRST